MNLSKLFNHYGTDKDQHGYTNLYHTLFNHIKEQSLNILEIGIGTMIPNAYSSMVGYSLDGYKPGGSLRAWRDYFINSTIYGLDVQPDTQFSEERIITNLCDSTNKQQVDTFIHLLNNIKFDIIIDDGSHRDIDQLATLSNFLPHLKDNGYYIIEDIYTGNMLKDNPKVIEPVCNNYPYFLVDTYQCDMCVIYKKYLNI